MNFRTKSAFNLRGDGDADHGCSRSRGRLRTLRLVVLDRDGVASCRPVFASGRAVESRSNGAVRGIARRRRREQPNDESIRGVLCLHWRDPVVGRSRDIAAVGLDHGPTAGGLPALRERNRSCLVRFAGDRVSRTRLDRHGRACLCCDGRCAQSTWLVDFCRAARVATECQDQSIPWRAHAQ